MVDNPIPTRPPLEGEEKITYMTVPASNPLMTRKPAALRLAGYSFLILFFELALIRFIPAHVRAAAYFINLVLIAAFLGMGVGLILQSRKLNVAYLFTPALLLLTLACWYFSNTLVEPLSSSSEKFFAIYFDISPEARKWGLVPVVSLLFVLTAFVFVPLGILMGREFDKFQPLVAYSVNIFGSLLGLVGFALLSRYSTPPLVWFSLGLLCFLALCCEKRDLMVFLMSCPLVLVVVFIMYRPDNEIWSPYYKINLNVVPVGTKVNVNGSMHQIMFNFSRHNMEKNVLLKLTVEDFQRPYKLVKKMDDVLIVGAGTGNDVVMALKQNAGHIDAVEIDRQILDIGRRLNPQKPYDDPRVSVHIDDARAYLKKTGRKYDLIVLGTLDSQTLLSGMSSIRLDNYIYTLEAFQSFKNHLKPGGILILYHMSLTYGISQKLYLMLNRVFGAPPLMNHQEPHRLFNFTFVAGSGEPPAGEFSETFKLPTSLEEVLKLPIPIDDWPYLYLSHPTVPNHYLQAGGIIAVFSLILVALALGRENIGRPDGAMIFLGASFLLLETKSVTEMSLLFGSTWQVNVLVFFSILLLVFMANLLTLKVPDINKQWTFIALFALVALSYLVPAESLLGFSLLNQWMFGGLKVALPLFFAGILFAQIFKTRSQAARSLGWNLMGSILGGLMEYSSMAFGTNSLYLLALLMYFLAYFCHNRESKGI